VAGRTEYPWMKRFMEVALRALRRVHYDYQLWSLSQDWTSETDPTAYNTGPGIECADELTVCAAITQEFVHSAVTTGAYVAHDQHMNVKSGQRFYAIYREVPYPNAPSRKVDIAIDRVDPRTDRAYGAPVFIEAKRAVLVGTKLAEGFTGPPRLQLPEIREDIEKLRATHSLPDERRVLPYLLVWGLHPRAVVAASTPSSLEIAVNDRELRLRTERWCPIAWNSRKSSPRTDQFLWIALFEVGPKVPNRDAIQRQLRPRVLA
jgi:hypothetical protein